MSRRQCPHGYAQADFLAPLGHRHQHDVHDADAADQQRHAGDGGEHRRHGRRRGLLRPRHLRQVADLEIVFSARRRAVMLAQDPRDLRIDIWH